MPPGGVPPGITACLARECLQASGGVNGPRLYVDIGYSILKR